MRSRKEAILSSATMGSIDGIGLAIGLLLVLGHNGILAAGAANAGSEFAGMASGQYLSTRGQRYRFVSAISNGGAAVIGVLIPIFAFELAGVVGAIVALALLWIDMAMMMPSRPWWRSWIETSVTIGIVVLVDILVKFAGA